MLPVVGGGGAPAAVDVVGVVDVHVTTTRGWAVTGSSGVPVGTHVDEPIMDATGTPPASTRTAPVIHCPVAHGGAEPVSAQPVTAHGDAIVTSGCPDSVMRGNGVVGVAGPA
jgi:hypothetical protein